MDGSKSSEVEEQKDAPEELAKGRDDTPDSAGVYGLII